MNERPFQLEQAEWLLEWSKLWNLLVDCFPHSKPSDRAVALYADRLGDLDVDRLRAAVEHCIATCRHLPTIAELREAAARFATNRRPTSLEAYGAVMEEASRAFAENRPVRFANPIAAQVVRLMGGTTRLLASADTALDRAHFMREYDKLADWARALDDAAPAARAALANRAPQMQLPAAPERQQIAATVRERREAYGLPAASSHLQLVPRTETAEQAEARRRVQQEGARMLRERMPGGASASGFRRAGDVPVAPPDPSERVTCPTCGAEYWGRTCARCVANQLAAEEARERDAG